MGSSGSGFRFFVTLTVLVSLMLAFILDVSGGPAHGTATQETTRTHELLSLQLSKEQVQSGSLEGEGGGSFLKSMGGTYCAINKKDLLKRYRVKAWQHGNTRRTTNLKEAPRGPQADHLHRFQP